MAAALITQADLELALEGGSETLRELAGDDGAGGPRTVRVEYAIAVASEEAYGLLKSGFPSNDQVIALVGADIAVRHAIAMIARDVLTQGAREMRLPDGSTQFSKDAMRARDLLRGKGSGSPRTSSEELPAVGLSAMLRPRASSLSTSSTAALATRNGRPVGF